jgi:hypothetical protein
MEEIFRYQQLRQTQKLSEEQKLLVGLALYPDQSLSGIANDLIATDDGHTSYATVISRYKEKDNKKNVLEDISGIDPSIRAMYDWLNFKARPIKKDEFKKFVESLAPNQAFDLNKEWIFYADNFILTIYDKNISINFCIDFQLLIRICYIFKLCIIYKNGKFKIRDSFTEVILVAILGLPILLPPKILRSRCSENCSTKGRIELPAVAEVNEFNDRNPCECKCDESCQKPSHHCICIRPYIGDLFIIKEELARYEEGDIADIENILAGEMKVRRHRNLYRTEDTTETENETITNEERDHQTDEKFTLQSEVKNTVDTKVGIDAGVTATLKYGDSITVTPHANVTANFSKSQSESLARSYAKEIIDRSVSKIQEKVRKLQVSKIITELEERNKHSIDNTKDGADHRAGIYYWVNKVTHAQVFNYGKHMMFDMIVPEPAATFKKLYQDKIKLDKNKNEPPKPNVTPAGIARGNYGSLLNQFAISSSEDLAPPDPETCVQVAFSQNVAKPESNNCLAFSSNEFKSPDIPKGYKAAKIDYDVRASSGHPKSTGDKDEVAVSVNVGDTVLLVNSLNEYDTAEHGGHLPLPNANWHSTGSHLMKGEEGTITVALAGFSSMAFSLSGTISITCKLKNEAFEKWQVKIYNLIMADYNRKLDAYKASINKDDQLIQIKGRNPFLNREIERNEFRRHIVAMLMCNYFNGIGSMMEKVSPCGYPEINFAKLEKDAPVIQFFEQVFEWNYVTYLFYHSMWARKCKWPDLIDEDSGDPLFDKFLMAGAARVQIPVRPGMEDLFSWFLKTGQIWGASGIPPVSGDDEYVSMIQELKESKQCDYSDRPGLIAATNGSDILKLTDSTFYWDLVNNQVNQLTIDNDKDRELLLDYKIYRVVKIEQNAPADNTAWNITIDRPFEDPSAMNLKHAVGALFVGAPWEIKIPTKLVYLRNQKDKLPVYPLT